MRPHLVDEEHVTVLPDDEAIISPVTEPRGKEGMKVGLFFSLRSFVVLLRIIRYLSLMPGSEGLP